MKPTENVHIVLSKSYLVYVTLFFAGIALDLIFPLYTFSFPLQTLGKVLLFLAPVLIFWAQKTSAQLRGMIAQGEKYTIALFLRGPYRFSRNPTHLGLTLLFSGIALAGNGALTLLMALFAHLITHAFLIKKEEEILVQKYGQAYKDYQSKVSGWA